MKKLLPIILAAAAFIVVVVLLQPPPSKEALVAARPLPAGHILVEGDVALVRLPAALVGQKEVLHDPSQALGQSLAVDRTSGDLVLAAHFGQAITLAEDERAIAVTVRDASGLAGLLKAGDRVGVTAILFASGGVDQGAYAKATLEGLRLLYISPEFKAFDAAMMPTPDAAGVALSSERATSGAVVLAVPTGAQALLYEFDDPSLPPQTRTLNGLELLAALDAADNAQLSLYLMPSAAKSFSTSGLWLPDLIVSAATATPTPTPGAGESPLSQNPTPAAPFPTTAALQNP